MKTLRKRPRADTHRSEPRSATGRLARTVYISLLAFLALAVMNFMWGDRVLFRADGMVVRKQVVVAASALSQVRSVEVNEGQAIGKGEIVMHIESTELLERLADLSLRQAELAEKNADLSLRIATAQQLLPLAEIRETQAGDILSLVEKAQNNQLVVSARYYEALDARYSARESRLRLQSEAQTLSEEIKSLDAARSDATSALANLRAHYADGVIHAPVSGTAGGQIPDVGDVFRAGEPMLTIYTGTTYVLAYLPHRYLFPIRAGMRVEIVGGRERDEGVITEILPLTRALPEEFQTSFRPRERNQLARINLAHPDRFPLLEKVKIRSALPNSLFLRIE